MYGGFNASLSIGGTIATIEFKTKTTRDYLESTALPQKIHVTGEASFVQNNL